ncbi:hypothetical protein D3C73_813410 [compost metagenome]
MAGQYTFRAVSNADVGAFTVGLRKTQVWTGFGEPGGHLFGSADRGGRFKNDKVAFLQHRSDVFTGRFDVAQVGLMVALERRGHRYQKSIGGFRTGGGAQVAFSHGRMHNHVQVGLNDMNLSTVDDIDCILINVDANHLFFSRSEDSRSGQADIPETNDGDGFERHGTSLNSDVLIRFSSEITAAQRNGC